MSDSISIEGGWLGTYVYKGFLQGKPPIRFEARFVAGGIGDGEFSGTILDDCGLGEATVEGTVSGRAVKFTKIYSSVKARSGLIEYQGLLSEDGKQITGTWRISVAQGVWEAHRLWREEREPEAVADSLVNDFRREDALTETAKR